MDESTCPGSDDDCESRGCDNGHCTLDFVDSGTALPAGNQTTGDCEKLVCDGKGATAPMEDDADKPNDGNDCTTDSCSGGKPQYQNLALHSACATQGGHYCTANGKCVECTQTSDCASHVCTGANTCATASCSDNVQNGVETDIDCGGTGGCDPCVDGDACKLGTDCESGSCSSQVCDYVLKISQVQTRGDNGGNDEFVEIYNPTAYPVAFDATWTIKARSAIGGLGSCATNSLASRFTGASGLTIPAHGHLVFTSLTAPPTYNGSVVGDGTYGTGIPDAGSVVLLHGSTIVDSLCFYFDSTTQGTLTGCSAAYICDGTPVLNPHDNTSSSNADKSLERKPGGSSGNTVDTGNSANDFATVTSDPHNLSSAPTP